MMAPAGAAVQVARPARQAWARWRPGDCGPSAFACRGDAPTMACALCTAKRPYATMSDTSGMRNGPVYGAATIYYPTGDARPPFGCVSVVPGFTAYQSSIRDWARSSRRTAS